MKQAQTSVLLVEDNPGDARLVQAYLDDASEQHFAVTHVGTLGEAELLLSKAEFDVVVLDLSLPDAHGLEAVRRTMAFGSPGKSLVVLTGNDDDSVALEALDAGAQDYLVKGDVATKELVRSLRYSIERKKAAMAKESAENALREALIATERRVEERTADLRCANEQLRESEERFRQLAENINGVFWLHDISANELVYVSPAFERIWGTRIDDLGSDHTPWTNSIHPEDRDCVASSWTKTRTVGTFDEEYRIIHPDGDIRWIHDRGFPIRDAAGKVVRVAGIAEDISEQKELETEREHAKEAAESANRTKSEFLATMSHELRTPLNGVLGTLELLSATELDAKQRRHVSLAKTSGSTLLTLLNDVLDIAKIEAGKIELERIDFEPHTLVESSALAFSNQAEEKGLELSYTVDSEVPSLVRGDPNRLQQILGNLIGNALKFTQRGEIAVRTTTDDETETHVTIRFTVTDTGIGIPPDKQEHVFGSFTQADASTTRQYGGSGLGLAISKQLVELMGGQIGVFGEPGKGSTFWFTVKLEKLAVSCRVGAEVSSSAIDAEVESAVPGGAEVSARTGFRNADARILLVEDNEIGLEVAIMTLAELGYECDAATNGREAVDAILRERYDLVLMDCQMPEMDGFEATRIIRQHEKTGDLPRGTAGRLPIVALTANAIKGDRERCLAAGMDDYLTKPLDRDQLSRVIEEWANMRREEPMANAGDFLMGSAQSQLDSDSTPPFNMEALVKRWGGKRDFVDTLVAKFLKQAPVDVAQLAQAVRAGNVEEATRMAHGLKGAAGYVAADALGAIAGSLEQMGREGDMRNSDALVDKLQHEMNRCTQENPPAETVETGI